MKVFCNLGSGEVDIPGDRPKEMELEQVLSVFRKMSSDADFMGMELNATRTLQFCPSGDGRVHVELLNAPTRSLEFCSLCFPEVEALIKAAFAGLDLKDAVAAAKVEWSLHHF